MPNIVPGDYEVRVTATGFSTAVQSSLALAVGQQQQLNFSMKVGQTSQTVQVTEAAPQVELTSSALSGQVLSETVRELPLNGRDWTSLATLQPGVARIETQMSYDTSARGNRGFGGELTISGQRSTFNNYRIDGISVNDYAMAAPGNVLGVVLGVDAIQEFSVLTGGFPAEYGRGTGGVVNAISKSGTNAFHGDVYEFLRNSALDSNDYFSRAAGKKKPPFRRNQFGVSAGGPIIKDRTFIFGDYEGLRQAKGIPTVANVPSANARLGILAAGGPTPTSCPANSSLLAPNAQICVNNYSAALLPLWPLPNGTVNGDTGVFVNAGLQIVPENFYTVRVDQKLGNNDSLFGTYLYDDTNYLQPDALNDTLTHSHTTRTTVAIEESHTFGSSFVNAARIGYNRDHVVNQFTDVVGTTCGGCGANQSLGTMPGQTAPRLSVGGGLTDEFGGTNSGSHYLHTWNSYQAYDDAFWTHGTHTIKFGGGVEWMPYNFEAFQNPGGRWKNFGGLTNFLQGVFSKPTGHFEAGLPQAITPREFRQTLFGAYVQDDWKFKPNLTLNVGLRYEMTTVLRDSQGKITSLVSIVEPSSTVTSDANLRCQKQFDAAASYGIPPQPGTTCNSTGPYYSNPTLRNFEPRIGFAWDPFKNGKTSVRGSFGIYDVLPLGGYFILQENQSAPFMIFKSTNSAQPGNVAGGFGAGNGQTILSNPSALAPLAASTIEPNPHRTYVMQWNLNVQRQIMQDTTLTVGYVGSRGVHLLMRGDDGNMTLPTKTPYGYEFPCGFVKASDTACTPGTSGGGGQGVGGATSAQVNQALGVIRYIYGGTDSWYNALNVNLDKRFSHGFKFQVAYSFAKSLDDDSQSIAGDTFGNGLNSPWWFLPKYFKGPSDFNVAHNLSVNALYDIPTPKSWKGVANSVLGGWELGSIVSVNSGTPTTPIITGDPLGLGNGGADQFGLPDYVPGCDPVNHGFANSPAGAPAYFNLNCFVAPSVPTSAVSSLPYPCAPFSPSAPVPSGQTGCANLAGTVGRNSITGPRFFNLDFSILKNFPVKSISEAFNVQFRAEMFNITNHDNFVPPQPDSGDGGADTLNTNGSKIFVGPSTNNVGGQIFRYASSTPSREIQFALKVNW